MSLRIVIVGSGGRLGAALLREWRARGDEVIGFNHATLDIGDGEAVRRALEPLQFDVLVNCAAQTNVDRCETHADEAFLLNAAAPEALGQVCAGKRARCVHISTDYVFDGAATTPYTEKDPARPISTYGASKREGEERVLAATDGLALVVRVSWVFGPDRPSFVDGIVKRAIEQEHVDAIADKVAVPTYTLDAAQLLRPLLGEKSATGLLHLCNGGECTWQEYGQHALDCARRAGAAVKATTVAPLKMSELKAFIARRPPYTAMSTENLRGITGTTPRPWEAAVEEYVQTLVVPGGTGLQV